MVNFRSKSCRDGKMQTQGYHEFKAAAAAAPPTSMQDLRSYTVAGGSTLPDQLGKEVKMKGGDRSYNLGSISNKGWSFADPELQRKTRVAGYKAYAVEGKMKGSLRKSFRWVKDTCNQMVHGWRITWKQHQNGHVESDHEGNYIPDESGTKHSGGEFGHPLGGCLNVFIKPLKILRTSAWLFN
ncbi:hypothetical protein Tsubulata_046643 [Turnera subulata]|uniref:Uncharacterized protein n=1 Tax=Turnera subulata TaxID=218843 RepID=A0A9Q0JIF6_9ROSI|nr:hypothetical protein Tsubulata_046643 [Turnera subulata]